jgi:hypothetical protein
VRDAMNLVGKAFRRLRGANRLEQTDDGWLSRLHTTYEDKRLFARAQSKMPLSREFLELFRDALVKVRNSFGCCVVFVFFFLFGMIEKKTNFAHYSIPL